MYDNSKIQDKFYKLRKVLREYEDKPLLHVITSPYSIYGSPKFAINSFAMNGFFDELMLEGNYFDISPLNLPSSMTMGIEIECVGPNKDEIINLKNMLQKYGINFLNDFRVKSDSSVHETDKSGKFGAEVVSPILEDTEEDWKRLRNTCMFLKVIGSKVNNTCGGHIHIGTNILGVDKKGWETFSKVWAEVEPLIYMISNRRGERTRASVGRYAKMSANDINQIEWKSVRIRNEEDISRLAYDIDCGNRYRGLNLTNVGNPGKNTIEFRLSNGVVDYNIWRENMLLYGRIIQMAKLHSIDPSRKQKSLDEFFEQDLSEKEKLTRFLNLVFDNDSEKEIFYKRWQYRAGETPVFGENSVNTYKRQVRTEAKPQSMAQQMRVIADEVSDVDRIEAMRVLIGEKERTTNLTNDEIG